jgi:hypothetical protein
MKLFLILAAPLALAAGLWLRMSVPLPPETRLPLNRAALEEAARRHAATLGVDAEEAVVWVKIAEQAEARVFAVRAEEPGAVALLHPGFRAETSLHTGSTGLSLTMNPHGDLLGFDLAEESAGRPDDVPEEDMRAAAEAFVRQWLGFVKGATVSPLASSPRGRGNRFNFEIVPGTMPGARFEGFVMMRGTKPVAARIRPEFTPSFEAKYAKPTALRNTFSVAAGVVTVFFAFYALYLYRRRAREMEAPKGRVRILVLLFALLGGGQIAMNFESVADFDAPGDTLPWYTSVLAALGGGLVMAMGGVLVGAAYGSGEGEIREGFPGKMVSFDALLAGRARNRNVGRSVAAGAAAAGWALLAGALVCRWLDPRAMLLVDDGHLFSAFGKLPWIGSVLSIPLETAFALTAGLFMPLTFSLRRVRSPRLRWVVLLACAVLVTVGFGSSAFVSPARLLEFLLAVVVLVAPFFWVDLLASVTALSLYLLAMHASAVVAVAPWMTAGVLLQIGLVSVVVAVLAWQVRGGETVTEEEVKPQYARNLDQRLSMRSEISAAREAQLRLLPANPPAMAGLTLAASCAPTGDVGADFYDFFPLPDGRLVVFVASGGGLGVASALTIALAKGYLMSGLRRGDTPAATLDRLRRLLSDRLGEVAQRARFALARIDPAAGTLEVARWGDVPGVWRLRAGNGEAEELTFGHGAHGLPETRYELAPGDGLVLHTEGLVSALEDQSPAGLRAWFSGLCPHGVLEAGVLHTQVMKRLAGGNQKVLQRRLRSDLTAVTLRLEPVTALARESAA